MENREKLIKRLLDEDEDALALKLQNCGQPLWLTCGCCMNEKKVETHCKRKWCPVCARMIAAARVARYEAAVDAMQWPLFVTFTCRNLPEIDGETIRKMRQAFGKLRKQAWWKRSVKGGVASVEVTNIGNGWHPHLHAIIDCKWFAIKEPMPKPFETRKSLAARFQRAATEVAKRWAETLGVDEARIKIKRAYTANSGPEIPGNSESIAREVLKYSCKSEDILKCEESVGDMIRALDYCRLVTSWGSCYGAKLTVPDLIREKTPCEHCGTKNAMIPTEVLHKIHDAAMRDRDRGKRKRR